MKKLIGLALSLILTLGLLTGCSSKTTLSENVLKSIWGKDPEQAITLYGLDIANAEVNGMTMYTFSDVECYGQTCDLTFYFTNFTWQNDTPVLSELFFTYADEEACEKALKQMEKTKGYTIINEKKGFYTVDDLSDEEQVWVDRYTQYYCGEQGIAMPEQKMLEDRMAKYNDFSPEDEEPLIRIKKMKGAPQLRLESGVYYYLGIREQYEALSPDGYPVVEE